MPELPTIYSVEMPGKPTRFTSTAATLVPIDGPTTGLSALNPYMAELTAIGWIIAETTGKWIGNCQYRRSWNIAAFNPSALHVPAPVRLGHTLDKHFRLCHGFDGKKMCVSCCGSGTPLTAAEMAATWDRNILHPHLMAVGPRESYARLWGLVMAQLRPIWDGHEAEFRAMSGYNRRGPAFIAERIMTGILMRKDKFLPGIPVVNTGVKLHGAPSRMS